MNCFTLTSYIQNCVDPQKRERIRQDCINELNNIIKSNRAFIQNLITYDLMNELKEFAIIRFSEFYGANFQENENYLNDMRKMSFKRPDGSWQHLEKDPKKW